MLADIKDKIEKYVAQYVSSIVNYKPIANNAKPAQYFSTMNIIKAIAANVYPQIYVDLVSRYEKEEAKFRLKRMGLRVGMYFLRTNHDFLMKHEKFPEIIIKTAKSEVNETLKFYDKVKEDGKLKSYKFKVKDCIFCSGIPPFENIEIPYCIAKAGTYESIYNITSMYSKDLEPKLVHVDVLKSAESEDDVCEYELTVVE